MATIAFGNRFRLPSLTRLGQRLSAAIERQRAYNRTLEELRMLSDRDLADLGIARADLAELARESIRSRQD